MATTNEGVTSGTPDGAPVAATEAAPTPEQLYEAHAPLAREAVQRSAVLLDTSAPAVLPIAPDAPVV